MYDTERESFHLHYGSYNTVRDNLFLGKNSCVRIGKEESHIQLFVEGNLFITQGVPIYGELRGDPLNLHSNLNIFCDMNNDYPLLWRSDNGRVYDLEEWRKIFGNDKDSSIESVVADALCRYSLLKCPLDKDFDIKRIILEKIIADT